MELSVGAVLVGALVILAGYLSIREGGPGQTATFFIAPAADILREGKLLVRHLERHLPSGGVQFMAYAGRENDQAVGRFLVPLTKTCRNLSLAGCEESAALAYIHRDPAGTPAVTAACLIEDVQGLGLDAERFGRSAFLVDLANPSFGVVTFSSRSRTVSVKKSQGMRYPEGPIQVGPGTLLAIEAQGAGYLWVATDQPQQPRSSEWIDASRVLRVEGRELPRDCSEKIRPGPEGSPAEVVLIPARPWVPSSLTGGQPERAPLSVPGAEAYPARLYGVQPRVLGFRPDVEAGRSAVAIHRCRIDFKLGDQLDCSSTDPDLLPVRGVSSLRIEVGLDLSGPDGSLRAFEPLSAPMVRSGLCDPPRCNPLNVEVGNIPAATRISESLAHPELDRFSLLKMSLAKRIVLRMKPVVSNHQESFSIELP